MRLFALVFLLAGALPGGLAPAGEPLPAPAFEYVPIDVAPPVLRERHVRDVIVREIEIPKMTGAGTASFNDWYLYGKPPPDVEAYRAQMAVLDPIQHLGRREVRRDFAWIR